MPKLFEDITDDLKDRDIITATVFELGPSWLEYVIYRCRKLWNFIKKKEQPKELIDYTISTDTYKISWLGGRKYSLIIHRKVRTIVTNVADNKIKKTEKN